MILVTDDDAAFRERLLLLLRTEGYEAIGADTIASAEEALRRGTIQLCIIDGLLPDGTGIELVERIRSLPLEVPIAFVSAYWRDEHTRRMLTEELKVERLIHKPISPAAVWVQIAELVAAPPAETEKVQPALAIPLEELRAQFLPHLRETATRLSKELSAIMGAEGGDEALAAARRSAHNLYGTAGSFGLEEVSELASHVESWLSPLVERADALPTRAGWRRAMEFSHRINELLAKSGTNSSSPARRPLARLLLVHDDAAVTKRVSDLGATSLTEIVVVSSLRQAKAHVDLSWFDGAIVGMDCSTFDGLAVANLLMGGTSESGGAIPFGMLIRREATYDRLAAVYAGAVTVVREDTDDTLLAEVVARLSQARRQSRPRVLLVDDDEVFAEATAELLGVKGVDVRVELSSDRLFEALAEIRPELVLLDIEMPGISGLDLCRMLRASPEHDELPVVFLTGLSDYRARLACFRAGCDDVIAKPIVADELYARVLGRLDRERLRQDRRDRDPLTGLLTRRAFLERLETALSAAERSEQTAALILIDLDEFKAVNDTHGHQVGDQVLATVGQLIRSRFRPSDLRGRWGGDELVVALPGEDAEGARGSIERLRRELRRIFETTWSGPPLVPSLSVGLAVFPHDGRRTDSLFAKADENLYEAKRRGRGRTVGGSSLGGSPSGTLPPT